eukprot:SAG31_NODE_14055_length_830_cov_0.588235_1_plen_22_part_10
MATVSSFFFLARHIAWEGYAIG